MYHEQLTVGTQPAYFAGLHTHADRAAVVYQGERTSWRELADRVHRLARAWENLGLERGDKVAVFIKNTGEYVELIYSLARVGVTIVPLSYRFVARELTYGVNHSDARLLVADGELMDVVEKALPSFDVVGADDVYVLGGDSRSFSPYEKLFEHGDDQPIGREPEENDILWLGFTGGTTGYPKACLVPQRVAVQLWLSMVVEFGIGQDDKELIAGPFYHGLGFIFGLQQLYVGGTVVIQRDFVAADVLSVIESERVTAAPMVPTMYQMLVTDPSREQRDLSSMRVLVSAGAPLLTDTKTGIIETFPSAGLFEYYGSTEGGFYTVLKPEDQLRKRRCCGQPFYGIEIAILDDDGKPCAPGDVGLIYKRGPLLGATYYKNEEATAEQFRGAWHTSGDMGTMDDEGYVYIVDRKKDMIISGGANIFPTEVEEALLSHPGVREVAVIGVPDERWGEAVRAFVVREPGVSVSEEELIAHCAEEMASFKKPRKVEFVDELPKSAAGKVLRREIRSQYWEGTDARV